MTDKTTDKITEEEFSLNHFEQADSTEPAARKLIEEDESTDMADLFTASQLNEPADRDVEHSFDSTWDTGRLTETDHEKKEPIIPENPVLPTEFDPSENIEEPVPIRAQKPSTTGKEPDNEPGNAQTPPQTDGTPTPSSATPNPGIRPITIFAIAAMLIAAIAVWFNPGGENNHDDAIPQQKAQTILNPDIQMQRMERRISSLEQQISQGNVGLKERIDHLEKQLSSLSSLVAKQTEVRRSEKHVAKSNPSRPKASITPVSIKPHTGWVVNLMSLDSLQAAKKALADFKAKGIAAEIGRYSAKGKTRYRIRVGGFASKQEAETQKKYLASKYHIKAAWVNKP
ncbi:MAG: SPOR domain-containing protein [Mariprofundus sp.]|nr:SPOR domain-containing protein [Mariprofundus sp.]